MLQHDLGRGHLPETAFGTAPRRFVGTTARDESDAPEQSSAVCAPSAFLENDGHVSDPFPKKFRSLRPRILIYGRSLRDAHDNGAIEHFDPADSTGSIYPTLYLTEQDVAAAQRLSAAAASVQELVEAERPPHRRKQRRSSSPRQKVVILPPLNRKSGSNGRH